MNNKYTAFGHKLQSDGIEYQIKGSDGIVFGRFKFRHDRDGALRYCRTGFPCEEKIERRKYGNRKVYSNR